MRPTPLLETLNVSAPRGCGRERRERRSGAAYPASMASIVFAENPGGEYRKCALRLPVRLRGRRGRARALQPDADRHAQPPRRRPRRRLGRVRALAAARGRRGRHKETDLAGARLSTPSRCRAAARRQDPRTTPGDFFAYMNVTRAGATTTARARRAARWPRTPGGRRTRRARSRRTTAGLLPARHVPDGPRAGDRDPDATDVYFLKWRYYFQEYEPAARPAVARAHAPDARARRADDARARPTRDAPTSGRRTASCTTGYLLIDAQVNDYEEACDEPRARARRAASGASGG